MPRPKTSRAKARLTGEIQNHPSRYADRGQVSGGDPVGQPPEFLSEAESAAWLDFSEAWPWVTSHDRAALATLCLMRVKIEDPAVEKSASMFSTYRLMISDFGGTPTSRNRIPSAEDEPDDDPFAQFEEDPKWRA